MLLIMSSRTILVPPACPLVDVLMSNDKATGRTAGVNGTLIHSKSSFYDCALHAKNNFGYFPNNYTFIRDIALWGKHEYISNICEPFYPFHFALFIRKVT